MKTAIVDAGGNVINLIELEDGAEWSPPDGCSTIAAADYEIGGRLQDGVYTPPAAAPQLVELPPVTVQAQDLMGRFTVDDIATIQNAIAADAAKALLWFSLLAQRDPMRVSSERFLAGWSTLTSVLGAPRMAAIAAELGVTID